LKVIVPVKLTPEEMDNLARVASVTRMSESEVLREAIREFIKKYEYKPVPIVGKKYRRLGNHKRITSFKIEDRMLEKLNKLAGMMGTSRSEVVRLALKDFVERHGFTPKKIIIRRHVLW